MILRIEADRTVLLAGHADAGDFDGADLGERFAGCGCERIDPPVWVLLAGAVVAGDQLVVGAPDGQRCERLGVHEEGLGGLGAAIDPEVGASRHGMTSTGQLPAGNRVAGLEAGRRRC